MTQILFILFIKKSTVYGKKTQNNLIKRSRSTFYVNIIKFAGSIIMYFILITISLTKPAFIVNNFTINRNIVDVVQCIPHV